jgi:hypothetical protein
MRDSVGILGEGQWNDFVCVIIIYLWTQWSRHMKVAFVRCIFISGIWEANIHCTHDTSKCAYCYCCWRPQFIFFLRIQLILICGYLCIVIYFLNFFVHKWIVLMKTFCGDNFIFIPFKRCEEKEMKRMSKKKITLSTLCFVSFARNSILIQSSRSHYKP